jgi:hypothetical protein
LQNVEISSSATGVPSLPMNSAWRTIRSYILWQHERGTLHYDIMVTLILAFIFTSPYWIDFKDKPVPRNLHQTVVVTSDPQGGLIYEISASAVTPGDDGALRNQLLSIIQPISGAVTIVRYVAIPDQNAKVQSYKVWVKRE